MDRKTRELIAKRAETVHAKKHDPYADLGEVYQSSLSRDHSTRRHGFVRR